MISKKEILEILHNPLVGHTVLVSKHTDSGLEGKNGQITWESYNLMRINIEGHEVSISKSNGTFTFLLDDFNVTIDGGHLVGDAKRRGKRRLRGW